MYIESMIMYEMINVRAILYYSQKLTGLIYISQLWMWQCQDQIVLTTIHNQVTTVKFNRINTFYCNFDSHLCFLMVDSCTMIQYGKNYKHYNNNITVKNGTSNCNCVFCCDTLGKVLRKQSSIHNHSACIHGWYVVCFSYSISIFNLHTMHDII